MDSSNEKETVAAPATEESVASEAEVVVKAVDDSDKVAPKAAEEPQTIAEATGKSTENVPFEELSIPVKVESKLVADLTESEKKALEKFKARIVKAIEDNEFQVPHKVVEAPKTTAAETPPAQAPATEATTSKTAATGTAVVKIPESDCSATVETPAAEPPIVEERGAHAHADEATEAGGPTTAEDAPASTTIETSAAQKTLTDKAKGDPPVEKPALAETCPADGNPGDPAPAEDVALWGVPLLHTKGDERTDVILMKFLRARDFNASLAFEQLKGTIIWRQTFKVDSLLEEDFGTDFDGVAFNYGKDKEGHPVCYNAYGAFQNKELYAKTFGDSAKLANFIRWRIQVLEKGIKLLNFGAEGPNAMVQITDLKNFPGPGKEEVISAYDQCLNILQDNYPELVVKKVFINVPWYFNVMYALVSPFISARTKTKFSRYTPRRTTEALLKLIPGDLLPIAYGGLSKPNDPDFDGVQANATQHVIRGGEKATIEIPVTQTTGTVVWDLAVVGYEVTYGAEYVPSAEGAYTTIIEKPKKLFSSRTEPLRSSFKVSEPGKVVISIDNVARKKKTALYRYTVKTPAAEANSKDSSGYKLTLWYS